MATLWNLCFILDIKDGLINPWAVFHWVSTIEVLKSQITMVYESGVESADPSVFDPSECIIQLSIRGVKYCVTRFVVDVGQNSALNLRSNLISTYFDGLSFSDGLNKSSHKNDIRIKSPCVARTPHFVKQRGSEFTIEALTAIGALFVLLFSMEPSCDNSIWSTMLPLG